MAIVFTTDRWTADSCFGNRGRDDVKRHFQHLRDVSAHQCHELLHEFAKGTSWLEPLLPGAQEYAASLARRTVTDHWAQRTEIEKLLSSDIGEPLARVAADLANEPCMTRGSFLATISDAPWGFYAPSVRIGVAFTRVHHPRFECLGWQREWDIAHCLALFVYHTSVFLHRHRELLEGAMECHWINLHADGAARVTPGCRDRSAFDLELPEEAGAARHQSPPAWVTLFEALYAAFLSTGVLHHVVLRTHLTASGEALVRCATNGALLFAAREGWIDDCEVRLLRSPWASPLAPERDWHHEDFALKRPHDLHRFSQGQFVILRQRR